jgi:chemotaxis protein MotB
VILAMLNGCVSESSLQSALEQLQSERKRTEELRKQLDLQRQEMVRLKDETVKLSEQNETLSKEAEATRASEVELLAKLEAQARALQAAAKKGVKLPPPPKAPDSTWAKPLQDGLKKAFPDELRDGRLALSGMPDRLVIIFAEALLFEPDDVDVSTEGEDVLTRLGETLRGAGNRQIVVGGHYDNSAMVPAMAREFPTAWEFTAARAVSVVRFLEEETRLGPQRLAATAYGAARAVTSNATETGRARNRRIDVTVLR